MTAFVITFGALAVFSMLGDFALTKNNDSAAGSSALLAPSLTATKTGALDAGGDLNNNGVINPGDRLKYQVVINNSGSDATGVNFSDALDQNTSYVAGSIVASPIAVNESYSAVGNVSITVPAASGVLVNDQNANTGAACLTGSTCTITTTGNFLSANGANVTLNSDGGFTFNPKAGFEGADTFTYTLSNGTGLTDSATVTVNVSGMIWFVNNNAGACSANCDGRLSNPFTTLAAFNTANALSGGLNPDVNDNIFVYESATQYTGAVTLRSGQKLIGQDAMASLQTVAGIASIPSYSASLPAMNSANAAITNVGSTVTLNTNASLRGFSINSTTATGINDPAAAISGVSVSELSVTSTTGTAILLSDSGGALTLKKVSANGAANGISLTNTTGSFAVSGDGTKARNGSGGAIQNTTGHAVVLSNAQNITLQSVNISFSSDSGQDSFGINAVSSSNITLSGIDINQSGVVNLSPPPAIYHHGFSGTDLGGTIKIDNNSIIRNVRRSGSYGFYVLNTNTNAAFTVDGSTFTNESYAGDPTLNGNSFIVLLSRGTSVVTINATGNTFTNLYGSGMVIGAADAPGSTAQVTANISSNNFSNAVANGLNDLELSVGGNGKLFPMITNNTFVNVAKASAIAGILAVTASDSGQIGAAGTPGTISGNTLQHSGTGSLVTDLGYQGIRVVTDTATAVTHRVNVLNNTIEDFWRQGMFISARQKSILNITVEGNIVGTLANPVGKSNRRGVEIDTQQSGVLNILVKDNPSIVAAGTSNSNTSLSFQAGVDTPSNTAINATVTGNTIKNTASAGTGGWFRAQTANISGGPSNFCLDLRNNILKNSSDANDASKEFNLQNNGQGGSVFNRNASGNIGTITTVGTIGSTASCTQPSVAANISTEENPLNQNSLAVNETNALAEDSLNSVESNVEANRRLQIAEINDSTALSAFIGKVMNLSGEIADNLKLANAFTPNFNFSSIIPTVSAEEKQPVNLSTLLAGETVTKSLGTLPANESITIQFKATVNTTPTNFYSVSNTANITPAGGININSTTATNTVVQPASIAKAFGASFIATGNTTTLTYTITNGNAASLSGLAFSDTLPSGLVINSPNNLTNSCGGTVTATQNSSLIVLSGGIINANATCTIKVDVKGTTEGTKTSSTSAIGSTSGGAGNTASATLNVINAPTFTKAFGAPTIPLNGSTTLSFTITNASAAFPLNNVSFADTLPAGLIVAATPNVTGTCGGGTISATASPGTISLSGATLAASANCTFSVNVTGTTAGVKSNSVTLSTAELGAGATATASVTVLSPATISKAFSPVSIPSGGTSTVTLTLSNANAANALTGAAFTDTLQNMTAAGGAVGGNCAGTTPNTLAAGAASLSFSGITIPAAGSCTATFNVTSNVAGVNPNTTSAVSSTNGGTGAASNTANLTVVAPPTITKAFSPDTILLNDVSTLTITLTNPSANTVPLTGVGVVDNFPAGLQIDAAPAATTSCGGTFAPAANAATLTISNATVPVGGVCAFSVKVKGTTVGAKVNTTNTVTSTNGGTGATATATLTVNAPTYSISGNVIYGTTPAGDPARLISGVLMSATGASSASVNTNSTGVYSLDNLIAGGQYAVTPTKTGDVSGINSFDATTVLRYLAAGANGSLTTNQQIAADTNGDGLINSFDATQVLRYLSANGQQSAATGAVGNWKFKPATRSYPSLNSSLTNENYEAILVGEVSGDWNAPGSNFAGNEALLEQQQASQEAEKTDQEVNAYPQQPSLPSPITVSNSSSGEENNSQQNEAAASVQISFPANATGTQNSAVVIPVSFTNSAGGAISGFNFGVTFDPNVLMLDAAMPVDTTSTLLNGTNPTIDTNTVGRIGISAANLNITAASGTLLNLRFKVIGTANSATTGTTALTFEQISMPTVSPSFQNDIGSSLTTAAATGTFTVTLAPTAASVSISGRVLTAAGRGINRARVTMTGSDGETRYAATNPFGYFHFANVPAGATYVFTVNHKQYQFAPQVLNLTEDITDLNFSGVSIKGRDEIK